MVLPATLRPSNDPRNGPIIIRKELLGLGYNDRAIARLVRDERLAKVRHGAYSDASTWADLDELGRFGLRGRAVLKQAKTPLVLSHTSGLPEYDAPNWGFDLSLVHTTRTDGLSGRKAADVDQHAGRLHAGDLVVVNGVPVMNPARIVLEATTLGGAEAGLCVANHMLHNELTTSKLLNAQYVGMESWPNTLAIEIVLRLADGRIESVGESRTYWGCYQQSLPMPEPQYKIRDRSGRVVARVDFAWPEFGVFLEFDGRIKYEKLLRDGERASDVVLREKRREELVCRLTGWRCIRITWADLEDPSRLAALIRGALFPSAA
jgi:hypothetical protein